MARKTLEQRLAAAQAEKAITRTRLEAAVDKRKLQYLNSNIVPSRKRRSSWSTPGKAERDMSSTDRLKAMAAARQKVEENPFAAGLLQTYVDNVVGSGFALSMTTKDAEFNAEVERRWMFARDRLDIRGVRSWGQLQRMWLYRKAIDGDVGIWRIPGGDVVDGRTPSYLQTIEADRIGQQTVAVKSDGVNVDEFGRPTSYMIVKRKATATDDPQMAPAADFTLYAHNMQERAERLRGVSQVLQMLAPLEDLEEINEAMLQKVKNESFMGIKFKNLPGTGEGLWGTGDIAESKTAEDGTTRKQVKLLPGLNLELGTDEDAEIFEGKSPNGEHTPYMRYMFRYIGVALGMPLEMILMDFSDTNYSGARGLMELAKKRFRVEQRMMGAVCSAQLHWWLSREVLHNGLDVPPTIADTYWTHTWVPPGWTYLDPSKEVKAWSDAVAAGFTTRQRVLAETGDVGDIEDVAAQLGREEAAFRKAGATVVIGQPGAAQAQPQPVGDDDEE